jgi:hypothetical protein
MAFRTSAGRSRKETTLGSAGAEAKLPDVGLMLLRSGKSDKSGCALN